jgi:hypothetical protein
LLAFELVVYAVAAYGECAAADRKRGIVVEGFMLIDLVVFDVCLIALQ